MSSLGHSSMNSIFSVNGTELEQLDAASATRTFRNLLWCETLRGGLSPHKVVISLRTTVSDGGIDARIDGTPTVDSILVRGTTYFQVKTGNAFKPWQRGLLKKELFGSPKAEPSPETLAPGIRECLRSRGRYVLVTFGHDLTPEQHSAAKGALTALLKACGYKNPRVDVLGQGQLLGLIALFPSLALELLGRDDLPFQSFDSWKAQDDMTPLLHLAPAQSEVIAHIRKALQGSDYQHIRVIGEPGIGKTRSVLEALSAEDLGPMVIYSPHAEDFQRSRLFNELLRQDLSYHAIMVIDECAEKERASIWGALKGRRNIRIVTIDHGPEDSRDKKMLIIDCPQLPEDQIMAIIASYLPKHTSVWHWAQWCSGSPRVAHAVGENLQRNPEDPLKPPATVPMWERFVAGYERLDGHNARDALIVLRHAALFTRFGFEDQASVEAQYICRLTQQVAPSMTWPRFQEVVERLRKRRILQGKRTLFIVPPVLHMYLWVDYWNSYGRGFDFGGFFDHLPSQLQHWFLQQFVYAHASPVASSVVRKTLSAEGPFSDHDFLVSEAGTRFLNYLAEANPAATLAVIERTFGTWSQEELKRWLTGRQDIVWALEKIAVWREYFLRAVHVLVKLALAENSDYGNNSTGILFGLFEIGPGWAATQASPEERLPVIEELLGSHERLRKELGLQLCMHWLSTHGGSRVVGAEYQGLRPKVKFWSPKIWEEVFHAWQLVWRHLFTVTRSWDVEERRSANRTIIEAGARALSYSSLGNEVMETLSQLTEDAATDTRQFTQVVIRALTFRAANMPKGILAKLRMLDRRLTGNSFGGRFARYVLNTTEDEDYNVKGNTVQFRRQPSQRVRKLAAQVAANSALFSAYLPTFVVADGHRLHEFGANLAKAFCSQETVEAVITAQLCARPEMKTQFIGGYFSGLKARFPDLWEAGVFRLLYNDTSREVGVVVMLCTGVSEKIIRLLLDLFSQGSVNAIALSRIAWQSQRDNIPQVLVEEVLAALVNSADEEALGVAIQLAGFYFFDPKTPRSCDEAVVLRLLGAGQFFRGETQTRSAFSWHDVAEGFCQGFPEKELDLLSSILSHPEHLWRTRSSRGPGSMADAIVRAHPAEAWSIVSQLLESDEAESIAAWLGDELGGDVRGQAGAIKYFDSESVMAWVLRNPAARARKLRCCLPKTLDEQDDGRLTRLFLEAFGDDEELSDTLIGYFLTGSWMGHESAYRAAQWAKARHWVSENRSGKVLSWLYRYIAVLNHEIEAAELREEREF
jgi:hypothetical protein